MRVLIERRDRERYLAVNPPYSLGVSKHIATNLAAKAIQLEASSSGLARLLISAVQMHWAREILILSANKCSHGSRAEVLQAQALLPSNTHNFPGGSRT
jgi:hypothetical protein